MDHSTASLFSQVQMEQLCMTVSLTYLLNSVCIRLLLPMLVHIAPLDSVQPSDQLLLCLQNSISKPICLQLHLMLSP